MQGILVGFLFTLFFAAVEWPRLAREQYGRELKVYVFLLAASFTLVVLYFCKIPIPSPLVAIDFVYGPIFEMFFGWLGIR